MLIVKINMVLDSIALTVILDAAMPLVVVITEGIPVHDSAYFYSYSLQKGTTRIIGPNCPGLISPEQSNVGIIPSDITKRGPIGLVSKSGTLTYQMMYELRDIGFSTAVGIGGDPVIGTTHIDCLRIKSAAILSQIRVTLMPLRLNSDRKSTRLNSSH